MLIESFCDTLGWLAFCLPVVAWYVASCCCECDWTDDFEEERSGYKTRSFDEEEEIEFTRDGGRLVLTEGSGSHYVPRHVDGAAVSVTVKLFETEDRSGIFIGNGVGMFIDWTANRFKRRLCDTIGKELDDEEDLVLSDELLPADGNEITLALTPTGTDEYLVEYFSGAQALHSETLTLDMAKNPNIGMFGESGGEWDDFEISCSITTPCCLFEEYEVPPDWEASHAYVEGEMIRAAIPFTFGTRYEIFRCTVAGSSGASPPAWSSIAHGATVVDGTMTWQNVSLLLPGREVPRRLYAALWIPNATVPCDLIRRFEIFYDPEEQLWKKTLRLDSCLCADEEAEMVVRFGCNANLATEPHNFPYPFFARVSGAGITDGGVIAARCTPVMYAEAQFSIGGKTGYVVVSDDETLPEVAMLGDDGYSATTKRTQPLLFGEAPVHGHPLALGMYQTYGLTVEDDVTFVGTLTTVGVTNDFFDFMEGATFTFAKIAAECVPSGVVNPAGTYYESNEVAVADRGTMRLRIAQNLNSLTVIFRCPDEQQYFGAGPLVSGNGAFNPPTLTVMVRTYGFNLLHANFPCYADINQNMQFRIILTFEFGLEPTA